MPFYFHWSQRQGPINLFEDPRTTCGYQASYHQQRPLYPVWDETATQEVPTGLEHCGSGRNINKSWDCGESWRAREICWRLLLRNNTSMASLGTDVIVLSWKAPSLLDNFTLLHCPAGRWNYQRAQEGLLSVCFVNRFVPSVDFPLASLFRVIVDKHILPS